MELQTSTRHGNLFLSSVDYMCTKTEVLVEKFVKNSKLESQEMELAVICQDRCDATFAGFLFQDKDATTERKILQPMKL